MKFETIDKRYKYERQKLSEQYGPRELWSVIDQWPLYCGIANLGRAMTIADLVRSTLDVPGHLAEAGSWRGSTIMLMAKLLRVYDPHGCKVVHCFESFEGLQTFQAKDGASDSMRGTYRGSYEEFVDLIELYELTDEIVIHKGLIQDTVPPLVERNQALMFSLVYLDNDLYEPTKLVLDAFHSRLSVGGLFVFDEWNYEIWPGETLAARGFLEEHGDAYEMQHVRNARQPSLVLKRIRH